MVHFLSMYTCDFLLLYFIVIIFCLRVELLVDLSHGSGLEQILDYVTQQSNCETKKKIFVLRIPWIDVTLGRFSSNRNKTSLG